MKFANLEPLSENFFDRMHEEDDTEEEMPGDDMPEPPMGDEPAMDEEPPMDDMGDEDATSGEMEEEIRSLMQTIADAVEDEYGVEVNVDGDAGMDDMGEEPPMDDMDDMGEEPPMDDMGEEPPMSDDEMLEEIFGDEIDSMSEEETLEEGANEATESNPGKGMTTQGANKTQAAPNKSFTENPGEEPGKGGHKLSAAPKGNLSKSRNTYGPTGDQKTDKKPPMANEVAELKESIAAVVRRMLKERRTKK